jgi:uncharacterized protein YggT (Ycf19 family)
VPALGGIDFSPMVAMLAILLMLALLVAPLADFGKHLAQAM